MALGSLFQGVLNAITNHTEQQNQSPNTPFNPSGLLGEVQNLFGQHAQQTGQPLDYGGQGGILPSSQDPYGDPADQQAGGGGILPSSQDPYGDPADQR